MLYYYSKDLPDYSQLANYHPPLVTRIYSADGKLMEEYAVEHRVFVPIKSVPRSLIEAFIAAEDKNFFQHPGVDILSIIRAAVSNISHIAYNERLEGGSTITQQIVKNFLLTSERSMERKIKEAILSYMLSGTFTKEQILELYLNQIFLGKNSYGIGAAAQNYFNKSVEELNLIESAFLAGLPKAPSTFNPEKNYYKAKERRDYVLSRMAEDGYINEEIAQEAIKLPIKLEKRSKTETVSADYFAEHVRDEVIKMYGKEFFYTAGLTIITSLDVKMQDYATRSLRQGIQEYDRKKGFKGAITNIRLDNWQESLEKIGIIPGILDYKLAVVLNTTDLQANIGLIDSTVKTISLAGMQWGKNNLKSAKELLKKGDIIVVEKSKEGSKEAYVLRQIPKINGAIMVMNPITGQVLAAQGGYDFSSSKFDRVSQALRQPGSLSKTFVFLAALENGIKPNAIFDDATISINQGPNMPKWQPKNYKGDFLGPITIRTGLEKSRNLITVRVAQAIGLKKVAEIIKRFGVNKEPKMFYSMVLGSLETTLEQMTASYASLANKGLKVIPGYIEVIKDRNGKVLYKRDDRPCFLCTVNDDQIEAAIPPIFSAVEQKILTDEASAYQITSMLVGAVERGTAKAAKKFKKVIAGKTGTTNESYDTWFIGYTPRIIVGTYIGYDTPKTLGKRDSGSTVALPVFVHFMEHASNDIPSLEFPVPKSIKLVSVNPKTGELSKEPGSIIESFKATDMLDDVTAPERNYPDPTKEIPSTRDIFDHIPHEDDFNGVY